MDFTALIPLAAKLISLYKMVLLVRVLLSWFPGIDWYSGIFGFLRGITDPILVPFRTFIPPIGGLDISPILAFLALDFLANMLMKLSITGAVNVPM